MDKYDCESCGESFDEFEMNFKAAQKDKRCLCSCCRKHGLELGKEMVRCNNDSLESSSDGSSNSS